MGEKYRLIDEMLPEGQPPLFSGRAIFLFTWFGLVIVGVVLSLTNAYRAKDSKLALKTILAFGAWLLMEIAFVAIALSSPEAKSVLRPISLAMTLALAFYLSHENNKVVIAHIISGGQLAPVWIPLFVTLAFWATCIGATITVGYLEGWR